MKSGELNFNECLTFLIKNSILTQTQVSIISKRLKNDRSHENCTAGSYYRQLKQCKTRIRRIIYTIILLKILHVIDDNIDQSLEQIIKGLAQFIELSDTHSDKYVSHIDYQHGDIFTMLAMLDGVIMRLIRM